MSGQKDGNGWGKSRVLPLILQLKSRYNAMEIKNLIFDFGKVLVDYDFMPVLHRYFKENREEEAEFCKFFINQDFIDACDREEIPFRDIIENAKRDNPRFAGALQFFYDNYADFVIGEMPGMRDMLIWLKNQGYKLYGLTNWCSAVHEVMERYGIFGLLDGTVISSEEHLLKPEPEIYRCVCERFGLKPEECLFADDKPVNVEGAKAIGMNAVVFTDAVTYASDLRRFIRESQDKKGEDRG